MSDSLQPHGHLPESSVHGISQARILEWNSHSLLKGIVPPQRLNLGLLHCSWILYHLSYQGSPICKVPMSRNFSLERSLRQCIHFPGLSATNQAPKTIEMCSFSVLEARSLRSRCCWQGRSLSALGESPPSPPLAPGVFW